METLKEKLKIGARDLLTLYVVVGSLITPTMTGHHSSDCYLGFKDPVYLETKVLEFFDLNFRGLN